MPTFTTVIVVLCIHRQQPYDSLGCVEPCLLWHIEHLLVVGTAQTLQCVVEIPAASEILGLPP